MERDKEITRVLEAVGSGDRRAAEELIPLVYEELRKLAAWRLSRESHAHTLEATALVHEAFVKLSPGEGRWENRRHFFAAAAEAMRRILIDRARARNRIKRGGEMRRTVFDQSRIEGPTNDGKLLAIDGALEQFARVDADGAELVKLRYFVGLTLQEIADASGVSLRTVKRQWSYARAWLRQELKDFEGD